jgi:hypothetical protein
MKPVLSIFIFWDCDEDKIDYARRANFVLERVFSKGTENDIKEAVRYYGIETIKNEIINIKDFKLFNFFIQNTQTEVCMLQKKCVSESLLMLLIFLFVPN